MSGPRRPGRVLHCITGLAAGGAEIALSRLLEPLDRCGWSGAVLALRGDGSLAGSLRDRGVRVLQLGLERPARAPRALVDAVRFVRSIRPDVIQGWMYHGNLAGSLAALLGSGRIPVAWNIRQALHHPAADPPWTRRIIRLGARFPVTPDAVIYNSRTSAGQHLQLGYPGRGGVVIPNGFDLQSYQPDGEAGRRQRERWGIAGGTPLVGLLARVHPVKGHEVFLRAAAELAGRNAEVRFVIAGEGTDEVQSEWAPILAKHGLAQRLLRLGRLDDPRPMLQALTLLVTASWSEAFPNAVGEAMACGVPCAVTHVGDAADLVGDTGLLVPPGDPIALAAAMDQILAWDGPTRRARGQAARERIERRFSLHRSVRAYAGLYETLREMT